MERWIPYAKVTKDLFGFGDLLAFQNGTFIIIQTTGATNFYGRRAKILKNHLADKWVKNGGGIILQAWDTKTGELKEQTWGSV